MAAGSMQTVDVYALVAALSREVLAHAHFVHLRRVPSHAVYTICVCVHVYIMLCSRSRSESRGVGTRTLCSSEKSALSCCIYNMCVYVCVYVCVCACIYYAMLSEPLRVKSCWHTHTLFILDECPLMLYIQYVCVCMYV
jgi:hypothetical protein